MAVLEKVMLAQGTRFRNLNGFFALENKKKQFRQPQKGTRMHKKRYGENVFRFFSQCMGNLKSIMLVASI
jgi:hypothetical protein